VASAPVRSSEDTWLTDPLRAPPRAAELSRCTGPASRGSCARA